MMDGRLVLTLIAATAAGLVVLLALTDHGHDTADDKPLVVHCAASMRKPVQAIADAYQRETGRRVQLNFGPSGALEASLEIAGGDLFLPADSDYIESIRAKGLVRETFDVTYLTAGVAVQQGNPKQIRSLSDLAREGVTVVLAQPGAAIGKLSQEVLHPAGLLDAIQANLIVTKPNVNGVAQTIELGLADAGVIWDALEPQYPNIQFLSVPEFQPHRKLAQIAVLHSAADSDHAANFARFLTASNRGRKTFRNHGYEIPPTGERWK